MGRLCLGEGFVVAGRFRWDCDCIAKVCFSFEEDWSGL